MKSEDTWMKAEGTGLDRIATILLFGLLVFNFRIGYFRLFAVGFSASESCRVARGKISAISSYRDIIWTPRRRTERRFRSARRPVRLMLLPIHPGVLPSPGGAVSIAVVPVP